MILRREHSRAACMYRRFTIAIALYSITSHECHLVPRYAHVQLSRGDLQESLGQPPRVADYVFFLACHPLLAEETTPFHKNPLRPRYASLLSSPPKESYVALCGAHPGPVPTSYFRGNPTTVSDRMAVRLVFFGVQLTCSLPSE